MRKTSIVLASLLLFCFIANNSLAISIKDTKLSTNPIGVLTKLDFQKIARLGASIEKMHGYIKPRLDGTLYIDQSAVKVVDLEALKLYQIGVDNINNAIKSGKYTLNVVSPQALLQPTSYVEYFWWGVKVTLNSCEVDKLCLVLKHAGDALVMAAAVAAFLPIEYLGTSLGVTSSLINHLYQKIRLESTSMGLFLEVGWIPVYISLRGRTV